MSSQSEAGVCYDEGTCLKALLDRCNAHLESVIHQQRSVTATISRRLIEAAHYAVSNGGKRIRPLLVYASAEVVNGNMSLADDVGAAIEMIHTYSLIHDDLPAMDDDDLRRGQPSCHVRYGEAIAILAGDYLQALAFQHLSQALAGCRCDQMMPIIDIVNRASIAMVAGQALDVDSVNTIIDETTLRTMHMHKTGALIRACVQSGACLGAKQDEQQSIVFRQIGERVGYAFQIQDDLLDLEQDSVTLGKPQGSDTAKNKPTYPSILGVDRSRQRIAQLYEETKALIELLEGDTRLLRDVCTMIFCR